ncbi:acyl-CoA dehydrogenase family protein [Pseudonocardia sp. CA-107938]|uniref:acyl-CoA dehydrogenase family protein n=1 Tax=Pseudonocardia sp. CA-107938 TaxID=3240021 RepID=UPI003D8F09DD
MTTASDEHSTALLEQVTREMLDDVAGALEPGEIDRPLLRVFTEAELLRLGVPEDAGGSGGGVREASTVVRLAAEYAAQVPVAEGLVAAWLLAAAGLPLPDGVLTSSAHVGGGPLVEGRHTGPLRRVAYGRHADHVVALLPTEDGHAVVDAPVAGAEVVHGADLAGEPRDEITPVRVRVTPVSEAVARRALLLARLHAASTIAGAASRATALAVRHAGERVQFGRPLAAFQAIQQQLAQAAAEAAAARCAAAEAVVAVAAVDEDAEHGGDLVLAELAVSAAKLRCNRAAGLVSAVTHQVHGAIGVTLEHALHRSTTLMLARRDELGADVDLGAALVGAVARRIAASPESGLWPALAG